VGKAIRRVRRSEEERKKQQRYDVKNEMGQRKECNDDDVRGGGIVKRERGNTVD
jgi:hypothetical protein